MAHYLVYWKPEQVAGSEDRPALRFSASNQYGKVAIGDVLWIVTSEELNDLVLVGRQRVDRIVGRLEAERVLRRKSLWDAEYYALSDSPEDKLNRLISFWAFELGFDGPVDRLPDGFTGQNLQTIRRLDFDSEGLMERLWADRDELEDIPAS
jgi:hypothetical protein